MFCHASMKRNSTIILALSCILFTSSGMLKRKMCQTQRQTQTLAHPQGESCMSNNQLLEWAQMAVLMEHKVISATRLVAHSVLEYASLVPQSSFLIPLTVVSLCHYPSYNHPGHTFQLLLWQTFHSPLGSHLWTIPQKPVKLVCLRSIPVAFQVVVMLFEQEFHHYSTSQCIIRKSPARYTAGFTPTHTCTESYSIIDHPSQRRGPCVLAYWKIYWYRTFIMAFLKTKP